MVETDENILTKVTCDFLIDKQALCSLIYTRTPRTISFLRAYESLTYVGVSGLFTPHMEWNKLLLKLCWRHTKNLKYYTPTEYYYLT